MQHEIVTEIKEIIQRTYNVKSLRLEDKGSFGFKPGQFCSLSLGEGKEFTHYISISNSPTEKGYLEVTKKLTESGFSKKLNGLRVGDSVEIKYPFGNFTFDGQYKKIAFLSGGIGITPIRSICKFVCDKQLGTDLIVLYGNHAYKDIAFREDLDGMQNECPNIKVVHTLIAPNTAWQGRTGYIDKKVVMEEIPDYLERRFYICGPPRMVIGMRKILSDELHISNENIIFENFVGY